MVALRIAKTQKFLKLLENSSSHLKFSTPTAWASCLKSWANAESICFKLRSTLGARHFMRRRPEEAYS